MHITQINVWCGVSPIAGILQFKAHLTHKLSNLRIANGLTVNKRLLCNYLKLPFIVAAKADDGELRFREISVVESYTVKGENWLDKIVQTYGLN